MIPMSKLTPLVLIGGLLAIIIALCIPSLASSSSYVARVSSSVDDILRRPPPPPDSLSVNLPQTQHQSQQTKHDAKVWEQSSSDNAVLDRIDSIPEMMEFLWNGGEMHGEDIWQKPKPLYEVDSSTPGRRIGFLLQFANAIAVETSQVW
jgi:broad specificity polyphosphatase/5'/3'-nucleotidase SurE